MFERAMKMFSPFNYAKPGEAEGAAPASPAAADPLDEMRRQMDEMRAQIERLAGAPRKP
jgi:polyhydroxyalkanoate synthesis regulator protein